ncbi:immunodominant staphylococcal antigen IsaB family protein [Staphylococcus nepalensis]|uniref:immunodominant staphylococcal antigen IsaB family protein n=1 Tax=Staphylococcus nepalensis TaxID=214473 RepID=UPI000DFEC073|nr:hypothetical protein [Staphylococcus nepalensis]SUM69276.1 immunodominant antigen B [Staphylococcus nepalensis]SUM95875.1 immunodominant antigen B [Staphylococcus nepalensis]
MNKISKIFVAGTVTLGTALGINISNEEESHNEAQAITTQPWYTYSGYTSKGGDFVLDQSFFNGLKAGNMTFNEIKVNSKYHSGSSSKVIYDQTFQQTNGKTANSVTFSIQNKSVSLKDIRVQYGENYKYQQPINGDKETSSDGLYGYQVGDGNIVFHVSDGYVTSAVVS